MLRLNMAIPPATTSSTLPSNLGLLGGDLAGFPNGRRVFDDVVTIEVQAIAGATLGLVDPSFTADGAASRRQPGSHEQRHRPHGQGDGELPPVVPLSGRAPQRLLHPGELTRCRRRTRAIDDWRGSPGRHRRASRCSARAVPGERAGPSTGASRHARHRGGPRRPGGLHIGDARRRGDRDPAPRWDLGRRPHGGARPPRGRQGVPCRSLRVPRRRPLRPARPLGGGRSHPRRRPSAPRPCPIDHRPRVVRPDRRRGARCGDRNHLGRRRPPSADAVGLSRASGGPRLSGHKGVDHAGGGGERDRDRLRGPRGG